MTESNLQPQPVDRRALVRTPSQFTQTLASSTLTAYGKAVLLLPAPKQNNLALGGVILIYVNFASIEAMKQNSSLLLPIAALLIGLIVVIDSAASSQYYQLMLGVLLVVASVVVFRRNLGLVDTDLSRKIESKLGVNRE